MTLFTTTRLAATAVIALCALASLTDAQAKDKTATNRAGMIWLDTNGCDERISSDLEDAGFALAARRSEADTVLKVDVHQLDAHTGASARYSATLRSVSGAKLIDTSGREDAYSEKKLCKNISDRVVDRLETVLASQS